MATSRTALAPSADGSYGTATVIGARKVASAGPICQAVPTGVVPAGSAPVHGSAVNVTDAPAAMAPAGTKMITPWSLVTVPPCESRVPIGVPASTLPPVPLLHAGIHAAIPSTMPRPIRSLNDGVRTPRL